MPEERQNNARDAALQLESIIASAMDAIISINSDQRIILFNPAAEKMFGVPASEALGEHINRFIPERFRGSHSAQVRAFGSIGATHRRMGRLGAVRGLRANGQEFPAEASISHVDTPQGKIYTVIMRDITERVASEIALEEGRENLERLVQQRTARLRDTIAELEEMSYSITHDMRAPLRAIQSFASILEEEARDLSPVHRNYLAMMGTAASRMDALIRDILTYSSVVRHEKPLAPLDPEALLRSIVATYPEIHEHHASVQIESGMPLVMANEALLTQCFSNLLSNAVKFRKPAEPPIIRVTATRLEQFVRLSFWDNGVGIPSELQGKIFGIFHRLDNHTPGTGIGLAIVRKAVEKMGGNVSLESAPDAGTTFHLDLLPG